VEGDNAINDEIHLVATLATFINGLAQGEGGRAQEGHDEAQAVIVEPLQGN
jgi:hypothetical protein